MKTYKTNIAMPKKDFNIDKDWLYDQYITKNRPTTAISKDIGCSHSFVGSVLKRFGIPIRSARECKAPANYSLLDDREWLYDQYIIKKRSTTDIAKEIGCSSTMVGRYLKDNNIEIRTIREANNSGNYSLLDDREWLYDQYIIKKRSTTDIAKEICCSNVTIKNYLNRHSIPIRSMVESKRVNIDSNKLDSYEWLYEEYVTKGRTLKDISEDIGYFGTSNIVRERLLSYGISIRNNAETQIKNPTALGYLENYQWMYDQYVTKNNSTTTIANTLECTHKTVLKYLNYHDIDVTYVYKRSGPEKEISDFLTNLDVDHSVSDRTCIRPLELDILIGNIAIELNGVYWHSLGEDFDFVEHKEKHAIKQKKCADIGISLLQFTCYEWTTKKEIIKSMVLNKLNLSRNKIFARKCKIVSVKKEDEIKFFNENHIQGHAASKICFGLQYDNEYMCMISFGSPRFNKNFEYEIIRIATKLHTSVVGGVSKLFAHFINGYKPKSIITYADLRYSTGKIYEELGFEFSHRSNVGFKWVKNGIEYNRCQFQKHKLQDKLKIYDNSLSSSNNMFANGYKKLYDCGQAVYIKKVAV